ncbi:MAG TPA: hypothetical protein VKG38_18645 [Solirubrobacteraceae bacterium]|nr:hypothetical protein [Solirubrobacteraceae bacterium]
MDTAAVQDSRQSVDHQRDAIRLHTGLVLKVSGPTSITGLQPRRTTIHGSDRNQRKRFQGENAI